MPMTSLPMINEVKLTNKLTLLPQSQPKVSSMVKRTLPQNYETSQMILPQTHGLTSRLSGTIRLGKHTLKLMSIPWWTRHTHMSLGVGHTKRRISHLLRGLKRGSGRLKGLKGCKLIFRIRAVTNGTSRSSALSIFKMNFNFRTPSVSVVSSFMHRRLNTRALIL